MAMTPKLSLPSLRAQGWAKDPRALSLHQIEIFQNPKGPIPEAFVARSIHSPNILGYQEIKQSQMLRNLMSSSPILESGSLRARSPRTSGSPRLHASHTGHSQMLGKRTPIVLDKDTLGFESCLWENQPSDQPEAKMRHPLASSPLRYEQPVLTKHRSELLEDNSIPTGVSGRRKRELIIRLTLDDPEDATNPLRPTPSGHSQPMQTLLRYAAAKLAPGIFEDQDRSRPDREGSFKKVFKPQSEYKQRDSAKDFIHHCLAKERKYHKTVQNIETYFDERKDSLLKMLDDL